MQEVKVSIQPRRSWVLGHNWSVSRDIKTTPQMFTARSHDSAWRLCYGQVHSWWAFNHLQMIGGLWGLRFSRRWCRPLATSVSEKVTASIFTPQEANVHETETLKRIRKCSFWAFLVKLMAVNWTKSRLRNEIRFTKANLVQIGQTVWSLLHGVWRTNENRVRWMTRRK